MAKRSIDKKVAEAIRALTEGKEQSIRDLVLALDAISDLDQKISALNAKRSTAIAAAETKQQAAREAGWKAKDLSDAGLTVPRPLDLADIPPAEAKPASPNGTHTPPQPLTPPAETTGQ